MDQNAPVRKPRGFKIALIVLAVLFVIFAAFIYLLPHFLPIGTIKSIAKSKAAEMAGVDVDFETLSFGWNGDVVLENITVAPLLADGTPGQKLLTVDTARTNVALFPLLSGKAIVHSVEVDGFSLKVRREADGSLNLPDLSKLTEDHIARKPTGNTRFIRISALAAENAPQTSLPPIELHRLDLKNGLLGYADVAHNMDVDIALDFMRLEGKTLDDPFVISGLLLPHPGNPELGSIPFQGRIAMLKNMGPNLDEGEATLEVDVTNVALKEIAEKAGFGELLASGRANGILKVAYANRMLGLQVLELHLADANLGNGNGQFVGIPDSTASVNAQFDPELGIITIGEMSLTNEIAVLHGRGLIDNVHDLVDGNIPAATFDFSGVTDFAQASDYLATSDLGLGDLPKLQGNGSFSGNLSLPAATAGGSPSPKFTLGFEDGSLEVTEMSSGITAGIDLHKLQIRAAASLGRGFDLTSSITLNATPAYADVPQIGGGRITLALNGGVALVASPQSTEVELRLEQSTAVLPATPWSEAATINAIDARVTAAIENDTITIQDLKAKVNTGIEAAVHSAVLKGMLAGTPEGQATIQFSAILDHLRELVVPVIPSGLVDHTGGSFRGTSQVKLSGKSLEAQVLMDLDSPEITASIQDFKTNVQTPMVNLATIVSMNLDSPELITIRSFEGQSESIFLRITGPDGFNAGGRLGTLALKAAGSLDDGSLVSEFSALEAEINGMNLALGAGTQTATITSGVVRAMAASPESILKLPLSGMGDFAVPALDFGIDSLTFSARDEQANMGNLRVNMAVDGYLGSEKRQLIHLRSASISAAPLAVNSRGQIDLGSGTMIAEYAARIAPAGLSPVLSAMGLPPALLADLAVSGAVSFNENQVNSKGSAQGVLSVANGESSPFEMAHDLSAAWNLEEQSLAVDVRRLDGNVKTASGEAAATIAAQQSRLLLSRAGSKGLLDIRVNGSAGPTRMLFLGLVGVVPQLAEYSHILYNTRADGVYNGWLQIRDKDESTLSLNIGGMWQGAALTIGGLSYIAEPDRISAGVEGEFAYRDNVVRLSRMLFRSNSAMMQADGQAAITFTADSSNTPTGLADISTNLRFVVADLAKAAMVFPGVIPARLGVTGRIDGAMHAGGDASDIRIQESAIRFQGFRVQPAPGTEISIQDGAATFGGDIALTPEAADGSLWEIFKMVNILNGQASLTGAALNGNAIDEMGASFQLENGVLALNSARIAIDQGAGGSLAADGRLDFNYPLPQATARWSMQNLPIPLGHITESVTMEGELNILDTQMSVPKFYMQTSSGLIQASGAGNAIFTFDPDGIPNGLATVQLGARFALADLARLAALVPDILPADLGLAGRLEGTLTAAGDSHDIRIGEGVVNFQGFRATPMEDVPVTIQSGSASFSGSLALNLSAPSTGSPYDMVRLINVRNGQAALSGAMLRDKPINEMGAVFQLEDGILTVQPAQVTIGGDVAGSVVANAIVDFNAHAPTVNARLAMRNIPLTEFNSEISDFMIIDSGTLNVPTQGEAAIVGFTGFSKDEILQSLHLQNFSFNTGHVALRTGPVLNAELDKARAILKMDASKDGSREITFSSITGTAVANGTGTISIPSDAPIDLIGDNTANFRARGTIQGDHTMDMKVMVTGKMENVISFSLPNIIPTLRSDGGESTNRLIRQMNASAEREEYGVHVKGSLENPDISGIGALAGQLLKDILKSSGAQLLGGALDLGKDAPAALVNLGEAVVGGVLNPGQTVKNAPENIIKAPENVLKGLGQAFGIGSRRNREEDTPPIPEEDSQDNHRERQRLPLPFGIQ